MPKVMTGESKLGYSGKYLGTKLKDMPRSYFDWLMKQKWFIKSKYSYDVELKEYISCTLN